jgi:hypothetical protein
MFDERTSKMSKKISLVFSMAILAVLFLAASGFAQVPSNDYTASIGNGSNPPLKIATASNYYYPAVDMVNNFLAAPPSGITDLTVTVHHDSTGTLETQIINDPGHDIYDYLFAADSIAPSFLTAIGKTSADTFRYANGVPSLFGFTSGKSATVSNIGNLISNIATPSATQATVPQKDTDLQALGYIAGSAQPVAVAVTPAAPYGTQAAAIFSRFATPPTTTTPYANISLTYDAVGTIGIPAGVVSKAQICADLANVAHVDFTGYVLEQRAIQLTSTGTPLTTWLTGQMLGGGSPSAWNAFLAVHCYDSIEPDI